MTEDKKMKIVISPVAMENINQLLMDATKEDAQELQEFLDEFRKSVEDGTLMEKSEPVDIERLRREDPEIYAKIMAGLQELGGKEEDD